MNVKNIFRFFSIGIFSFLTIHIQAQNIRAIQEGDAYFDAEAYYSAAKMYDQYLNPVKKSTSGEGLKLYRNLGAGSSAKTKKIPSKADVHLKAGHAYRLSFYFEEAVKNYEAALQQDASKYAEALYWMAVCKRNLGRLDESQALLDRYTTHPSATEDLKRQAKEEQTTIAYIRQQTQRKDTSLFIIQKADTTSGRGYFAFGGQGNTSFVVSGTLPSRPADKMPVPFVNRLFSATASDKMIVAGLPLNIDGMDGSMNQMAGTTAQNGNMLYFTQWGNTSGKPAAQIYYAKKKADGNWSAPMLLPGISQEGSNQKHPCVSEDGKILFFASDRTGGSGKYDIWYAALDAAGMPSPPENAGAAINTSGDEVAPFYHLPTQTLVFSSNGRQGMGGFDFYYAEGKERNWKPVENAGYPLNSYRDELFFYAGGKKLWQNVFFSSDRNSDCCMQLFHLEKLPKKKIISGKLADCKSTLPLSDVLLTSGTGIQVKTDAGGSYSFEVDETVDKEITLSFQKDKYTEKTFIASLAQNDSDPLVTQLTAEALCLEEIVIPEPVIVKKEEVAFVNFDFNKSNLLSSNFVILDSFYRVLRENPTFTVKIDAHTDTKGTDKYNLKLSNRRANAVANFFLHKGIEPSRMIFEGFGKCCPLEPEVVNGKYDNEAARRNRRALIHISRK